MNKVFMPTTKGNMIHELKDCPCCGGESNIFHENFGKTVWVQCTECGLSTSRYGFEPVVDGKNGLEWAMSRWNMRCGR